MLARLVTIAVAIAGSVAQCAQPPADVATSTPPAAVSAAANPILPAQGALFGGHANVRNGLAAYPSLLDFERLAGRHMAIANRFHNWTDTWYGVEREMVKGGRTPMVSLRPTDGKPDTSRATRIASGAEDAAIAAQADQMKGLGVPVLLRFGWEMDQAAGQPQNIGTAPQFVQAWRHVHDVFVARGATNVQFVWAPRAAAFRTGSAAAFYPGDAYVDWIAASAVPPKSWNTFTWLFKPFYDWGTPHGKPMLIWTGESENPTNATWKASWFDDAATVLQTQMPLVRAFVYYHAVTGDGALYWADTTSQSLAAFHRMGCQAWFNPAPTDSC
jgi:hypothetical protein